MALFPAYICVVIILVQNASYNSVRLKFTVTVGATKLLFLDRLVGLVVRRPP